MLSNARFNPAGSLTMITALALLGGCATTPSAKLPDTIVATPFERIDTAFEHEWNKDTSFPFSGGAAIDIDNDGTMEIFVSGGHEQNDAVLSYQNGRLENIVSTTGLTSQTAGYGATAVDMNNDGQTDLVVARDDGVWVYINNNGRFEANRINYQPADNASPLAVAVADIDNDGDIDMYLSHFIKYKQWVTSTFNKPDLVAYNHLLRNDGDLNFTDITESSGTAGTQNTFLSAFTDLDQDGYQDLVISNNTGTLEILHNEGNSTFTKNSYDSGLGYWMGLGIGDFDGDGDQDLASSNVSNSIPAGLLRGDLTDDQELEVEWVMLRNDGNRVYTDITEASGLTGHGFGWGIVFEDLNLDGNLDVLAAQSYIKWPPHRITPLKGRTMLQVAGAEGRQFINAPALKLVNREFGQSAVMADLDGDAKQDVVWINMNGPVIAALNRHAGEVVTLAVPENAQWLGARVTAQTSTGQSYTREVTNAVGMQTDQSPHISFAIPAGGAINSIDVAFADGTSRSIATNGTGLVRP